MDKPTTQTLHSHNVQVRPNAALYRQGSPMEGIYIIQSGKVKVKIACKQQRPCITYIKHAGDWLGIEDLDATEYHATAIAMDHVVATFIPKDVMHRLLKFNPHFSLHAIRRICNDIDKVESRIQTMTNRRAKERFAQTLLEFEKQFGYDRDAFLDIKLSMKDIAELTGVTNETVSRLISEFKQNRIIDLKNGRIRLLEPTTLQQIAGQS
jgi:CRP/FNR family transcriptional regulator